MRYSADLRKRVLDFIQAGGSKTEAAQQFNVGRTTIYKWLNAPNPFAYQIIEASGASLMFLPPYSPDYNPIEHDFANIKRIQQYQTEMSVEDIIQMYQ